MASFKSVSASAARYQNLSVNPAKLSGQCGRLKCCLNYELNTYLDALKDFPKEIKRLKFKDGKAELFKTDIFKKLLWYNFGTDRNNLVKLSLDKVHEILDQNKKGLFPDNPDDFAIQEEVVKDVIDIDLSEDSLSRFDTQKKKGRKNKRRKPQREGDRNRKQSSAPSPRSDNRRNNPRAKKRG
jgi:hypothetical protein